jgi:hypothetical protein
VHNQSERLAVSILNIALDPQGVDATLVHARRTRACAAQKDVRLPRLQNRVEALGAQFAESNVDVPAIASSPAPTEALVSAREQLVFRWCAGAAGWNLNADHNISPSLTESRAVTCVAAAK